MADNNVITINPDELAASMAGAGSLSSKQNDHQDESIELEVGAEEVAAEAALAPTPKKRERSQRYVHARSMVDRTKFYSLEEAIELVKRTAYGRFEGTITAHMNLKKEMKPTEVKMPHNTGKKLNVAIATEDVLAEIEAGNIDFDVLLATPQMMPKIAKFARVLGPKGLMPNPKTGTVTSDPEAKKEALQGGAITIKSERKAPLLHVRVGKENQPTEEIVANIEAVIKAVGPTSVLKLTLAPTMGPGVKVSLS